jgi:hypothetical protein
VRRLRFKPGGFAFQISGVLKEKVSVEMSRERQSGGSNFTGLFSLGLGAFAEVSTSEWHLDLPEHVAKSAFLAEAVQPFKVQTCTCRE